MGKNVLVTGGSGRLGNYVCPFLKEKGYNVTNFDVVAPAPGTACFNEKIPYIMGDFTNLGDCMRAIAGAQADVIVHLGAIPNNTELQPPYAMDYNLQVQSGARFVQRMPEDSTMRINTMGTYYLLDAARRLNVKDVVFASSYFALGIGFRLSDTSFEPEYLPLDENHPCLPEDTYSLSKYLDEEICKAFTRAYGMKAIALRLLGVYYDNSEMHRNMYKFGINVPAATAEDKGWLSGNTYQFVDSRDIANIIALSIEKIRDDSLKPFEAFFVATDTTYLENTTEVIEKRWPFLKEKGKNMKGTDGLITVEKAEKLLGYKPTYSWRNK